MKEIQERFFPKPKNATYPNCWINPIIVKHFPVINFINETKTLKPDLSKFQGLSLHYNPY